MPVFYGPNIDGAYLNGPHGFLLRRGWRLDENTAGDEDGCPMDAEAVWRFPESLGGVTIHAIADVSPAGLSCRFDVDEEGLSVLVISAGNWASCDDHHQAEHSVDVGTGGLALDRLAQLLDDLEPQARALDARAVIECRFFGPCGQRNERL